MKTKAALMIWFCSFICILAIGTLYAQEALQEIVRFELPGVVQGFSSADPGGDINGDGKPDLVFAYWKIRDVDANIYIYHSIPDSNAVPDQILSPPSDISGGFGYSLAYAGDLNGDGIDDLVVGIQYYGWIHQGAIAIYWGGATLSEQPDVFIDGYPFGYTQSWDLHFGKKLISHCDINGDGINDLLVYAAGPQYENWGNIYVFLGGTPFNTTPALHIRGNSIAEDLGRFMDSGDINGDGFDDIIVCSQRSFPPPPDAMEGLIYDLKIYSGGVSLSNVPVYEAEVANYLSRSSVSGMIANGDLDGDGKSDITMLHHSHLGPKLKIMYGQQEWTDLSVCEADLNISEAFWLRSYCNLINDPYSDLLFYSNFIPGTTENYPCICICEQTSPTLDLNIDYLNSDYSETHSYGIRVLGDMNQDGYNEFLIFAFNRFPNNGLPSYVKILSQSYTAIVDDVIPVQEYRMNCYPNPFNGLITIDLNNNADKQKISGIKIFDMKGRMIFKTDLLGINTFTWDGNDMMGKPVSSGVYILQATNSSNKKHLARIIRMK